MMINNVNTNSIGRLPFINNRQSDSRQRNVNTPVTPNPNNDAEATQVDISDAGRVMALRLQSDLESTSLRLPTPEERQAQRAAREAEIAASRSDDPLEMNARLGVIFEFPQGTLEGFISDALGSRINNSSLVAAELGSMIRGTFSNPDASIHDRAVARETALRHARQIAEKYFDNAEEAQAFLDTINRFAENDVLREQGYIVFDNSDIAPFRNIISPVTGGISFEAFARQHGVNDIYAAINDTVGTGRSVVADLVRAIGRNQEQWSDAIVTQFEQNANRILEIINNAKTALDETAVNTSWERLLGVF